MRLNFKKVSAIAASALMVGMTMGVAAAATTYPAPFVSGTGADVAIVYGTGAGVSALDSIQGYNINLDLQARMGGSEGTTTSATGGDSKILSTSARKLYYGDAINAAYSALGASELGSVLADGTFTDLSGTAYGYIQTVKIGTAPISYGTSSGDLSDPVLYIDAGTTATAITNLYNYTLSFTKNLNVSDGVNVQGQKVKILGVDYVIGTSSTNTTLYLYGSGETMVVTGAETKTVSISGTDHTIKLITTADATHATITVDGVSKSVVEGSNYAFSGDINVYIKDVIHPAYAGDIRQAELIVGASTLKLVNGATVKKGADATSVQGTSVRVAAAGDGIISGFTVAIAAAKAKNDSIEIGQDFIDPVFGGLKLTLAAANPDLDSTSRGKIAVRTDDTSSAYVTFTSALAGSAGEKEFQYVYDNDTTSTTTAPLLAGSQTVNSANGRGRIHVMEGETAKQGDWIVVNQGDAGKILYVEDISLDTETTGTVTFSDAITGESIPITVTNVTGSVTGGHTMTGNMFGGTGYTVTVNSLGTALNVTWDNVATRTLFPRIKLANGGWMAFLTSTNITNASNLILPNGITSLETTGQNYTALGNEGATIGNITRDDGIDWIISNNTAGTDLTVWGINNTFSGVSQTTCNFNVTRGPAILYIEPKKWDDSTHGDIICIPMGAGTTEITIGDPVFNGTNSGYLSLQTDTYMKKAVDKYGAIVIKEDRTNSNGVATINFPSSQMYFDVVFSAIGTSISGGTAGSVGGQIGNVVVKDTEVSSVSSKNLIVIGGSCINSVAANLLGGAACGTGFTDKTGVGSGQFLIQSVASTYSSGKVALVVAGYEADDTVNAATYLMNKGVDTTAGKKYKGTTATSAELVTTETA